MISSIPLNINLCNGQNNNIKIETKVERAIRILLKDINKLKILIKDTIFEKQLILSPWNLS